MDRFSDLEQRWVSRRRKRITILGVLAVVVVIAYIVYIQFFYSTKSTPVPKAIAQTEVKSDQNITAIQTVEPKKDDKKPLTLTLNKSFEEDVQKKKYDVQKPAKKQSEPKKQAQGIEKKPKEAKKESAAEPKPKEEPIEEPKKESPPEVFETKAQEKIEEKVEPKKDLKQEIAVQKEEITQANLEILYIEEFLSDKTYAKALKIAKFYFENNKHDKAIKWSLEANKINSAEEESWIIFAKSSIALGRADQAKRALSTYLQKRDSINIKKLYNEIR